MKLTKIFDCLFLLGVLLWILFCWILPTVFNTDNDVTLGGLFGTVLLVIYFAGRVISKLIEKLAQ